MAEIDSKPKKSTKLRKKPKRVTKPKVATTPQPQLPPDHSNMDFGPPKKEHHYYPYKKLYRSRSDKWVGGVCGGLAQYFKIDPVLVRLSWVIITLFTMGAGIIGYILFWIFVDKEPRQYKQVSEHVTYDDYGRKHVHHYYDKVH